MRNIFILAIIGILVLTSGCAVIETLCPLFEDQSVLCKMINREEQKEYAL